MTAQVFLLLEERLQAETGMAIGEATSNNLYLMLRWYAILCTI